MTSAPKASLAIPGSATPAGESVVASPPDRRRSGVQVRQPAQRAQPRYEAVLAAAGDDEARQVLQPTPDGLLRDGEDVRLDVVASHRVFLARVPDEVAVVDPVGLDELELPVQVSTKENPDQAAVDPVVLEHTCRQWRPVGRAAPDDAVQPRYPDDVGITGVDAPDVCPGGALEAAIVVCPVEEIVVSPVVGAELGIVLLRGEGHRRPARPAPDHLRRQERLLLGAGAVRTQVLTPGRHTS